MFNVNRRCVIGMVFIMMSMITGLCPMQSDAYFTPEIQFGSDLSPTDSNSMPDLAFDDLSPALKSVHMVWANSDTINDIIYHQSLSLSGVFTASQEASSDGSYLGDPSIVFGLAELKNGFMVCTDGSNGVIPGATIDMTQPVGSWFSSISETFTSNTGATPVSIASTLVLADSLWLAYTEPGVRGIIINRHNGFTWSTGLIEDVDPLTGYHDPQICIDDLGYIYLVYYAEAGTPIGWFARRSISPNPHPTLELGFLDPRLILAVTAPGDASDFVCDVYGGLSETTDATFAVAWVDSSFEVHCQVDVDAQNPAPVTSDWVGGAVLGGSSVRVSSLLADSPANLDIAIGWNRNIQIVWEDYRTSPNVLIYGSRSFDLGGHFVPDRQLSPLRPGENHYSPTLAADQLYGHLALGYASSSVAGNIVLARLSVAEHVNNCDDPPLASYWQTQSGVSVSNTVFHDFLPTGNSYKIANAGTRGSLVHDFGSYGATGSVSLWFYDDPISNTTENFWVELQGDDGSKAGIFRMVGVRNETTMADLSFNPTGDIADWVNTGISRGTVPTWHHVVISVDEDGLVIFLDPETELTPIHTDSSVVSMTSIGVEGGSDAEPYYLDDIRIVTEVLAEPVTIPALSGMGILILLIGAIPVFRRIRLRF